MSYENLLGERVLVVAAEAVEEVVKGTGFISGSKEKLQELLKAEKPSFLLRDSVEDDQSLRQFIPYAVVRCGGKFLSYRRAAKIKENRLSGKKSIGVGGHVNKIDETVVYNGKIDVILNAAQRELDEELEFGDGSEISSKLREEDYRIIGFLKLNDTEVDKVHLGVVFEVTVPTTGIVSKDEAVEEIGFLSPDQLKEGKKEYESWSQLLIERL